MESIHDHFKQFLAGNFAGWGAISVSQPLDFIKTQFQINYKTPSILKMVKDIGFLGFYRGASSLYVSVGLITYYQFTLFQHVVQKMNKILKCNDPNDVNLWSVFAAGAAIGLTTPVIYNVIEYSKIVSQVHTEKTTGSAMRILQLTKKEGLAGIKKLMTGLHLTYLRQLPGCIIYYMTYNVMIHRIFQTSRHQSELYTHIISGGVSGMAYQIYIYPIDVIKTNYQAGKKTYKQMIRQKFWRAQTFKTGFLLSLARSFITDATNWTVYERFRKFFSLSQPVDFYQKV